MVTITITPAPDASDPDDSTGLTLEAYEAIMDFLGRYAETIDIQAT